MKGLGDLAQMPILLVLRIINEYENIILWDPQLKFPQRGIVIMSSKSRKQKYLWTSAGCDWSILDLEKKLTTTT